MRRILSLILIGIFWLAPHPVSALTLSQKAEVSVLTCGTSNMLHTLYGHTAIRVNDPIRHVDLVFNYGVFSFSSPNFAYRFAKGQTDYLLALEHYADFYKSYKRSNRSIYEQVLRMTTEEKQNLFNFLIENAKPENREYRYNFFLDNCATRVRDAIINQLGGELVFPEDSSGMMSFRAHVFDYQEAIPWINFGINLSLGSPSDQLASAYEEMFLPDLLMKHFSEAQVKSKGKFEPLVKETNLLYKRVEISESRLGFLSPYIVFSFCFALILFISIRQYQLHLDKYLIDYFLLFLTGLIGGGILWFVLVSEHPAMKLNYNLIWALPTNFIFMFLWMKKEWRGFLKWYWLFISVWLILFLCLNFLIPQSFHFCFLLLSLSLILRALFHSYSQIFSFDK